MLNIKIAEIHENVLHYLPMGGIIELIFLLEIFFIIDNDYIPILPTKLSTTYLTYMPKRYIVRLIWKIGKNCIQSLEGLVKMHKLGKEMALLSS